MAELTVQSDAFLRGLHAALQSMENDDGADFLETAAEEVVNAAERYVHRRSGAVAGGIGMAVGHDGDGAYVDVGVISPPDDRHDFYLEYGTYKDPPYPFMRPALAVVASGIGALGGSTRRAGSATSRAVAKRSRLRGTIRSYRRSGSVSTAEARLTSRAVSNRYRTRRRRRR